MGRLNKDETGTSQPMFYHSSQLGTDAPGDLETQVQRLHRLTVWGRWAVVLIFWITIAPLCLWALRETISLATEYFTWSAVRIGLRYNLLATAGLALCLGCTFAVLLWQSRNILFGLSSRDRNRLIAQVLRIRKQGNSHPLWNWICRDPQNPQ